MEQNDRVSLEIDERGIAHLRLMRADKLNALDNEMFRALADAGHALNGKRGLRAVIVSGQGRAFCSGIDLASFQSMANGEFAELTERTHGYANLFQHVAMQWRKLPVPVIAVIHGVCFGGGLQLASGADIRIAAPDARLSIMETKWGLVPDMGGFALWRAFVREDALRELVYTAREFNGEEAQLLGFATYLDADPLERARQVANMIAQRSPHAVRAAKALINRAADAVIEDILLAESHEQHKLMGSRNQLEAVNSQLEKRAAKFVDP